MKIAIVGCGFAADYYLKTLPNYPTLELVGVTDKNPEQLARCASYFDVPAIQSLDTILSDPDVSIVLNLTNPDSHFEVSRAILEAGKHVYSEKPLAMEMAHVKLLAEIADKRRLHFVSAPCSVLGETAQTIWKGLRENVVGKVRLVYAELDDGMLHRKNFGSWRSESGARWPYEDEFAVGCTLEHAGYYVSWLVAFFGPARSVSSFTSLRVADKGSAQPTPPAPDFSVACIEFHSGVVARMTCSIVAPRNHALQIIGDEGVLTTEDAWDYASPVTLRGRTPKTPEYWHQRMLRQFKPRIADEYPLVRQSDFHLRYANAGQRMDQARGVAELASAIEERRPCRLSTAFSVHCTEIALAMHEGGGLHHAKEMTTTCEAMAPMLWAV